MFTIKVTRDIAAQAPKVKAEIIQRRPEILNAVGVQVLSIVMKDYNEKSRGRMGVYDRVKWDALERSTLDARVRRRGPARKIVESRRSLAAQIKTTRGKGSVAKIKKLRDRRKAQSARLEAMVDKEVARHQIGVDSGLQRASGAPGFRGDQDGGNVFNVDSNLGQVKVGFGREYSKYFDEKRTLVVDPLPQTVTKTLEAMVAAHFEKILKSLE